MTKLKNETAVVVTTLHRGIFVGYANNPNMEAETITLSRARMVLYYSAETKGLTGIGSNGLAKGSRVTPAIGLIGIRDVTSIAQASEKAVLAWEAEPWD